MDNNCLKFLYSGHAPKIDRINCPVKIGEIDCNINHKKYGFVKYSQTNNNIIGFQCDNIAEAQTIIPWLYENIFTIKPGGSYIDYKTFDIILRIW